jgi:hypothetical protein
MLAPQRKYKSALFQVVQQVDAALQNVYPQKRLWQVKDLDAARLTRLLVWSERYGVSLEYILETVLEYYYRGLRKHSTRDPKISRSLGIRIQTLVSDGSLAILVEHLNTDFPDGNNLAAFKEDYKERIADILDPEAMPRKARNVLQFRNLDSFVNAYTRQMELRRKGVSRVERKMNKISWRGNPWL